jgi:hypothetical protein
MKFRTAMGMIEKNGHGYRVSFERRNGASLTGDYFPERDEMPICTELEAWDLARRFAIARDDAVNVYVIRGDNFVPVDGYERQVIRRYPDA